MPEGTWRTAEGHPYDVLSELLMNGILDDDSLVDIVIPASELEALDSEISEVDWEIKDGKFILKYRTINDEEEEG